MKQVLTHLDISTQITIGASEREAQNAKNHDALTQADQASVARHQAAEAAFAGTSSTASPSETSRPALGAYIHIPFCFHKCHYCDFYSIVDNRNRQTAFTQRLIEELATVPGRIGSRTARGGVKRRRPKTVFIGGGTPTLLATACWEPLLEAINNHLVGEGTSEFTVEANPETVTPELMRLLAGGGVNRLSIGAQSFNPAHLKTLERWHEPANVARAIELARAAGIDNVNLDLIFAIPGQSVEDWREDLLHAMALEPTHVSCYGLMYEPNTPLTQRMHMGRITPVEDDVEAAMYELARDLLGGADYEHYEISAWAKPGRRCAHNIIYWRNHDWWPFGPSAAGHVRGLRWKNIARLGDYLAGEGLPAAIDVEQLDEDGRVGETLMLGLRLLDGIALDEVDQLLALGRRGEARARAIERLVAGGLLSRGDGSLRLTSCGLLMADSVISELL